MTQIYSLAAALVIVAALIGAVAAIVTTWAEYGGKAVSALFYRPDPDWWPEPQRPAPFEEPAGVLRIIIPVAAVAVWLAVCGALIFAVI